jgi:ABC-type multidrug transport system permease subunit
MESLQLLGKPEFLALCFISIIIFIFIGLANSIDDILSEKRSIKRELKLNVPAFNHLFSKTLVLFFMTLVQILLYYYISAGVLGMRGYLVPHALFLLLSGMTGYSLGLLFSSIIKDRNAVINILPLVIIPQIMFSGAVIRFADMNSSLRLNRKSEIPEFCHFIPSRWLYEGWLLASGSLNLWQRQKDNFLRQTKSGNLGYEEYIKTWKA